MPRELLPGVFYTFDRTKSNREIGDRIPRNQALLRARAGKDVYTPMASDALSFAKDVHPLRPVWDGSHQPRNPTDWDFDLPGNRRYPHYHPGGQGLEHVHVFYGERGYRVSENRRV
jgi:hypothetical protein